MSGLVAGSAISESEVPVLRPGEDHGAVSVPQLPCWHTEGGKALASQVFYSPTRKGRVDLMGVFTHS